MNIKCTLGNKSTIVSAEWLLEHDLDALETEIVCGDCQQYHQIGESGEPGCYGECVEKFIEELKITKIKYEVEK